MDHQRHVEGGGHFLRSTQHLVVVLTRHRPRQPRLDADDDVAVLGDRIAQRARIGERDVHGVAIGQNAGASDIDQHAALLR